MLMLDVYRINLHLCVHLYIVSMIDGEVIAMHTELTHIIIYLSHIW